MAKIHEYCCCAIPLLNFGIYITLAEQITLATVTGTLAIATPSIVGASVPSFAPWLLAIVCYAVAAIQLVGFFGVFKENLKIYKTYLYFNSLAVSAAFGVAAAFIGISAARHNTALKDCEAAFFASPDGTSDPDDKSRTLCNIFTWLDIGLMGGLWIFLAIFQFYILLVTRFYGTSQASDHKKYYSIYSVNGDDILLNDRAGTDAWDARASTELDHGMVNEHNGTAPGGYGHVRQASNASTIMGNEPMEHRPQYAHHGQPEYDDRRESSGYVDDTYQPQGNHYQNKTGYT